MTEAEFGRKIRDSLKKLWTKTPIAWWRIENTAALGTPDTFIGSMFGSGWIEMKVAGPNAMPKYRPGQPGKLMDLDAAGVPAHTLIGSEDGSIRLIGPHCTGPDWEEHLVAKIEWRDKEALRRVLLHCMTGSEFKTKEDLDG